MALSGIEIFKLLPKTNCGDCGVPTCLAFAMSLAAGRSDLSRCPHIDKDSKTRLEEASAPPIRPVTIGSDAGLFKTGGETVLFRHEKRFENPTGIACLLTDSMPQNHIQQQLQQFGRLRYERAGEQLRAQLIAIRYQSGQEENYLNLVRSTDQIADASLILMCPDPVVLEKALRLCHRNKPLIHAATTANYHQVVPLALEFNCPLAIRADNVKALAELCQTVLLLGVKELILDSGAKTVKQALEDQVLIRRSAILSKYRPLGFPTICFPAEITDDAMKEALVASLLIARYAGIVVLSELRPESLFPLLVERTSLFADPQRPLATKEGIYEIGNPDQDSPIILTSNFSLTYFIVSAEIEASRVPAYLMIKDTEGLSVMTAWAAGKFSADSIARFVNSSGIANKVSHRRIIIPGYLSCETGSLEEELAGWTIETGPREAAQLPVYLRDWNNKGG